MLIREINAQDIACSNAQPHKLTSGTTSAPFAEGVTWGGWVASDTFGMFGVT
jgi:hypothetical protein